MNVLLVGIDERPDEPAGGARADSIVIAHIPATHDHVYLLSLPRDTRAAIPAYPETGYRGGTDKVNAAFAFGSLHGGGRPGGFELLALTVRELTGLSFSAGAIVNFDGLRKVVDAVGGVDLCVDERTTSVHIGWDASGRMTAPYRMVPPDYHAVRIAGVRPQVYEVGCRRFVGWEALDFARQRELLPDGDYGRQRHQQQLITALVRRLTSAGLLTNPIAADRALSAIGNAVTFDGGGVPLTDWMLAMRGTTAADITMVKTNRGRFSTQVIGGQDFEVLSDTSRELFDAAADDRLDAFVRDHPDWVTGP